MSLKSETQMTYVASDNIQTMDQMREELKRLEEALEQMREMISNYLTKKGL